MDIFAQFDELKSQFSERDERHHIVTAVRRGDIQEVMPGVFPDNWPKPITANVLETASRDFAEMLGSLPQISCQPLKTSNTAAKQRADKKTKVALGYITDSRLQPQMYSGADSFFFYGA